jgi:hypothetical protein
MKGTPTQLTCRGALISTLLLVFMYCIVSLNLEETSRARVHSARCENSQ